jgi:hypothetical protein
MLILECSQGCLYLAKFQSPRAITRPKIIEPEQNVNLICNSSLYTQLPKNQVNISKHSEKKWFQILLRTKYVPSLVKIHWKMLILECSQGCYRVKIRQWILTKLGTYLVLKRIWNPIDFQGHRSMVKVTGSNFLSNWLIFFLFWLNKQTNRISF